MAKTYVQIASCLVIISNHILHCENLILVDTEARLPSPSANHVALYDREDSIYIVGGYNGVYQNRILKYSLRSGEVELAGTFLPIAYGTGLMNGGYILHFGGITNETRSAAIYQYSTDTKEFGVVSHFPTELTAMALAWDAKNQTAYMFGGLSDSPPELNQVWWYNATSFELDQVATLSAPRYGAVGVWDPVREVAYVFGGRTKSVFDILQYNPRTNNIFTSSTKFPTQVAFACAVYAENDQRMYVIGGRTQADGPNQDNIIRFNPKNNEVEMVSVDGDDVSSTLTYPGCVYISKLNRIYVIGGGEQNSGQYSDKILYLDLNSVQNEDDILGKISTSLYYLLLLVVPVAMLIGIGENVLSSSEIQEFQDGIPNPHYQFLGTPYVCRENINYQPYDRAHELKEGVIRIDKRKVLGSGAFGVIVMGTDTRTGKPVAVKTIKALSENKVHLKALLSELKMFIYIGSHPHVVNLIGASTTQLRRGVVYLYVEFCPFGDLENYLRKRRNSIAQCMVCKGGLNASSEPPASSRIKSFHYLQAYELDWISVCDLLRWSTQVASAMEYLASKNIIHGDLASRNILLLDKSCAKVTDFGLSRKLYNYTTRTKLYETQIPWRSMAFESLVDGTISTKSDVWSFAVALWEIFSLGEIPYSTGAHFSMSFIVELQEGFRLQRPQLAPTSVFQQLLRCWNLKPDGRPSFAELHSILKEMGQNCKVAVCGNERGVC